MAKYRKKPVVVEAVEWTGDRYRYKTIREFCGVHPQGHGHCWYSVDDKEYLSTLEGEIQACIGDYIIKGVKGDFYTCKPDVFEMLYERVEYNKFRTKPVIVDAITFDEFVEYGKINGGNIVNGMPWSFTYNGHQVTHENDERYLVSNHKGIMDFTTKDMLITGINGEVYPCKIDIFKRIYERNYGIL